MALTATRVYLNAAPLDSRYGNTSDVETFAEAEINRSLMPEEKVHLLRQMIRSRRFGQTALKYYQAGVHMGGFLHLHIGQESVAVGTISLCGSDDHIITGYRDHGHPTLSEAVHKATGEAYGVAIHL